MSLEIWLAFAFASTALLAVPGPTVVMVVACALSNGRNSGWATVPGVALGDLTAMTVSLAGAGAVLAASATLFTVLKLAGAAYLVWLGIRLWRSEPVLRGADEKTAVTGKWRLFLNAFVVTALNPKGIVFFVAFVPQFVAPGDPLMTQFSILIATFVALGTANAALWAVLAGDLRRRFGNPGTLRNVNRAGGGFLIGAAFVAAAQRA